MRNIVLRGTEAAMRNTTASSNPTKLGRMRRYLPRLEELEARLAPALLPPGFQEAPLATGLNGPTAMEIAPDGRLWVLEQSGSVQVFHPGSTTGFDAFALPASALDA